MTDAALNLIEVLSRCPCCLQNGPDKALNKPNTDCNKTDIYIELLKECFNIDLNVVSDKCGICEQCVGRLRDASDFKLQVQRSQATLQEQLEGVLQVLDQDPDVKPETEHWNKDDIKEQLSDIKSEEGGTTEDLLDEDTVKWEIKESEDLIGPWHDTDAVSARARQQLAMTCVVRLERLRGDEAPLQCRTCYSIFDQESTLATHMEEHISSSKVESEDETYRCQICGDNFTTKLALAEHIHMKSCQFQPETVYPNDHVKTECARTIVMPINSPRRHKCEICTKLFTTKQILQRHVNRHLGYKPFICEICNRSFSVKSALKIHSMIHTGRKPHECNICPKRFSQKTQLARHVAMHNGKAFICTFCGSEFAHKVSFVRHIRVHTGQTPYRCELCDKPFGQKSELARHVLVHTGEQPHGCEVCGKRFTRASNRRKHLKKHAAAPVLG